MATTMTLAELRTAVRQRADMVNSLFCSDAEINSYINQSYFELYDLLVSKFGADYYASTTPQSITTTTADQYSLASDFYKLLGVDIKSGSDWLTMRPFTFGERNRGDGYPLRYRLLGSKLWLSPAPNAGESIRVWYVPRMTTLAQDSDTLEGVSGWTEYVILDATIKAKAKEESDVSVELAQKAALVARIELAAANRDIGSPARVVDVYRSQAEEDYLP